MAEDEVEPGALAEQFLDVSRRIGRGSRRAQLGPLSVARYDVLHAVFHQPDLVAGMHAPFTKPAGIASPARLRRSRP